MRQILNERRVRRSEDKRRRPSSSVLSGGEAVKIPLPSPDRSLSRAHGSKRARTCAGRRFAHSVQQVLEHHRVVMRLVLRSKQEREAFSLVGQLVELLQIFFSFGTRQFFQIALAKDWPSLRLRVHPFAQFVGGSKIAQPLVHGDLRLSKTT